MRSGNCISGKVREQPSARTPNFAPDGSRRSAQTQLGTAVGLLLTRTEEARGSNPLTSTTSTNVDPARLLGLPGTPQIGRERLTASPLQPRMRGSPRRTTSRAHYRGLAWVLGMCVLAMYVWWRRAGRVVDQQGGPPPGHEVPGLLRVVFSEILTRPSLARTAMHSDERAHHCLERLRMEHRPGPGRAGVPSTCRR